MESKQDKSVLCQCEVCGKNVFVPVIGMWTYKKADHHANGNIKYFCGWNCMRKYEKAYDEESRRRRSEGQKRGRKLMREIAG